MAEVKARLSVKSLVEQTLMSGSIDDRWSGRSTALEGVRGHQFLQGCRGAGYEAEKVVEGCCTFCVDDQGVREIDAAGVETNSAVDQAVAGHPGELVSIHLKGRIDGVYLQAAPLALEEIKTLRGDPALLPESHLKLHWGQLRIYAHLMLQELPDDLVNLRMCYFDLDMHKEHVFEVESSRAELRDFFINTVGRYCRTLTRMAQWWTLRDGTLDAPFPHGTFRRGQRALAAAAWRTARDGGEVVLQAPTGIGKTMGVLYPAVRALRSGGREKVFFLTAKTVGRKVAEQALTDMMTVGMRLRSVTIMAKEKVCLTGTACDPEICQYANGYFDRRDKALDAAFENDQLGPNAIELIAREHTVCPFELALDAARRADVVVCDYNYVFDPVVRLRRFFDADEATPFVFVIDEVHNLVDRGRDMFSARLQKSAFLDARRQVGGQTPAGKLFMRANRCLLDLRQRKLSEPGISVTTSNDVPQTLVKHLKIFMADAELMLRKGLDSDAQGVLLSVYFEVARYVRTADTFTPSSHVSIIEAVGNDLRLHLFCVDPAPGLREGLGRAEARVLFSATLFPQAYYARLLGVQEEAPWYALPSPFESANLGAFVVPVETTYHARERTAAQIASMVADFVSARRGNYLIFFPSYAYMTLVADHYQSAHGESLVVQERQMDESAREAWLAHFRPGACVTGFALMGGIFGEGIDLAGDRLIGVMVIGVGLPKPDTERNLIQDHFGEAGREFAFAYPGMQRVLQTAGRLIRSEHDRGVLCLVDARFAKPFYRSLMPKSWHPRQVHPNELGLAVQEFWSGVGLGVSPAPGEQRIESVGVRYTSER